MNYNQTATFEAENAATSQTENGALIDFFHTLTPAEMVEPGSIVILKDADGNQTTVDLFDAQRRRVEEKKKDHASGTFTVHTPDAFVDYINRHGTVDTEVWFDMRNSRLYAQIDAHSAANEAGLQQHRVEMKMLRTLEWTAFLQIDRKWMSQYDLAMFIQDHYLSFKAPTALEALQIAENFTATRNVEIASVTKVKNGAREFVWKEEEKATGQFTIPDTVTIKAQIFEFADPVDVQLRWNYRINDKQLQHRWLIEYKAELEQLMFKTTCEKVAQSLASLETPPAVFYGEGK